MLVMTLSEWGVSLFLQSRLSRNLVLLDFASSCYLAPLLRRLRSRLWTSRLIAPDWLRRRRFGVTADLLNGRRQEIQRYLLPPVSLASSISLVLRSGFNVAPISLAAKT